MKKKKTLLKTCSEKHKIQQTYGLAEIQQEPTVREKQKSKKISLNPFKLPLRWPGWYPDAINNPSSGDESGNDVVFPFPEEALNLSATKSLVPFPVPHSEDENGQDVPFLEPDIPRGWADFYSWILGGGLPPKKVDPIGKYVLIESLRQLGDLARKYNSALHRLRRLHFYYKMCDPSIGTLPGTCVLPPHNKFQRKLQCKIDDRNPPNCFDGNFSILAAEVETHWQEAASDLNRGIETAGIVDVVEVNGYIVSIRLVIPAAGRGKVGILELGGSSSQISVSSAFSSPSDDGMGIRSRTSRRLKAKSRPRKKKK